MVLNNDIFYFRYVCIQIINFSFCTPGMIVGIEDTYNDEYNIFLQHEEFLVCKVIRHILTLTQYLT